MKSIQQMIETILYEKQAVVLVMIVNVDGSAYRKEGTWMILKEDSSKIGVISGGCLENDLQHRAMRLFNTGNSEVVYYDLSAEDDIGWGRGAGCNGIVSILVRDINDEFRHFLNIIYKQLLANKPTYLIQSMVNVDDYVCMDLSGNQYGDMKIDISFALNNITPFQHNVGQKNLGDEMIYFQLIWPQPSLYIIGTGYDAQPLARLAEKVGYAVKLFDWRSEYCNEHHFPMAVSFQIGDVAKLISNVTFSSLDSVVIMTHDFQLDAKLVRQLIGSQLLYLGILGSKERTKRLYDGAFPNGVHSPIGLSIGADGPEEIAVSIVAELIAVRRAKLI